LVWDIISKLTMLFNESFLSYRILIHIYNGRSSVPLGDQSTVTAEHRLNGSRVLASHFRDWYNSNTHNCKRMRFLRQWSSVFTVLGLQHFYKVTMHNILAKRTCRNMDIYQNRYQENGGNWDEIIRENWMKNHKRENSKQKN
jgi:hypothetical protein